MLKSFSQLSDTQQGLICIVTGTIVLLYALGIIGKGINMLVIAVAVCAIVIGCARLGLFRKASTLLGQSKKH